MYVRGVEAGCMSSGVCVDDAVRCVCVCVVVGLDVCTNGRVSLAVTARGLGN